ncbi:hypothetical protein ACM14_08470 [Delftia sp. JD2]|nr:hypothetical protein ACM14_08470 [Delftia sp. JD2]
MRSSTLSLVQTVSASALGRRNAMNAGIELMGLVCWAAGRAYDLYLTPTLQKADLVHAPSREQ